MRRRFATLLSLSFVVLVLLQLIVQAPKALAAGKSYSIGDSVPEFCVPELKQYGSKADNNEPGGWLSAKFINRATIQLTYNGGHKCDKLVGETAFGSLFAGPENLYVDRDIGDNTYEYINQNPKDNGDGSGINNFNSNCGSKTGDNLGQYDRSISTQDIRNSCLKNGSGGLELKLSIIESMIPGYNCQVDEGSDHFTFANEQDDGKANIWKCESGFSQMYGDDGNSGVVIVNDFSDADLAGFNITYTVVKDPNTGDSTIVNVSPALRGDRTFYKCNNGYNNGQNCSGDLELLDSSGKLLAYGALNNLGAGTATIKLAKVGDHSHSASVVVAGDTSDASKTPGAGNQDGGLTGTVANGASHATCDTTGDPLTWLLCPVFNGVAHLADFLFNQFITPFLQTSPVSTSSSDPTFKIWSGFRIYGNIVLIIAILVIVFAQSIGGGLIDAYTAKKVVPRILIAAILINLSVYLVAFLVDITNILGKGIGELMLSPIANSGGLHFQIDIGQSLGAIGLGLLGTILGAAGIAGTLGALIFGGGAAIQAALFLGLLVLLPVILAVIGVFVTLIIRRGLILFLILISPFAFALYCLPNTEQYFRKWWKLLFEALLVYPIVVAIFAVADIMSVTILTANHVNKGADGQISNVLAAVVAFVLQFLPLVLIPFAFKFAGGTISGIHAAITGGAGKLNGLFAKRKEYAQKDWRARTLASRDRQYRNLAHYTDNPNARFRGAARFLQRRVGGYNLEEAMAAQREAEFKLQDTQNNFGDDTEQRALTVNKDWALANDREGGTHWRMGSNGQRQFRTLGGAWVDESAVDAAYSRWGGNQMALQWSLGHEMDKAATQEEQDYLRSNYRRLTGRQGGFGMSGDQAQGVWKGAGFQKQNVNRQWKHYRWDEGQGDLALDGLAMMREIDEKQGNYQMLMQNADTWTTMSSEMMRAQQAVAEGTGTPEELAQAQEILERGARIAWATRSSSYADFRPGEGGEPPVPLPLPPEVLEAQQQGEVEIVSPGAPGAVPAGEAEVQIQQGQAPAAGGAAGGGPGTAGGAGGRPRVERPSARPIGAGAAGRVMEEANAFVRIAEATAGPYSPQRSVPAAPERPSGRVGDAIRDRRNRGRDG